MAQKGSVKEHITMILGGFCAPPHDPGISLTEIGTKL